MEIINSAIYKNIIDIQILISMDYFALKKKKIDSF